MGVSMRSTIPQLNFSGLNRTFTPIPSKDMFEQMASLVDVPGTNTQSRLIWPMYFGQYIELPDYCTWFIETSGISSCYPNNNPDERYTQYLEGTKTKDGLISQQISMSNLISGKLPHAIFINSLANPNP